MSTLRLTLNHFLGIKTPLTVRKEVLREEPIRRAVAVLRHGDRALAEMEAMEQRGRP